MDESNFCLHACIYIYMYIYIPSQPSPLSWSLHAYWPGLKMGMAVVNFHHAYS